MQRLTREVFQRLDHGHTGCRRDTEATAVGRISDQREVDVGHVHANLVGSTGFQLDPHVGVGAETLEHAVVADRLLAALHHRHALALLAVTLRLLVPAGDARAALERFYRRAARTEITPRLDRAAALTGSSYRDLSIRAQRTRWASCSADGRMSFNWRLLLAPERVLDYVVWHEVCHLEILDHSPRFWALLERRWPGYREDRDWLSRHGATLVL